MLFRWSLLLLALLAPVSYAKTYYQEFYAPRTASFDFYDEFSEGFSLNIRTTNKHVNVSTTRLFNENTSTPAIYESFVGKPSGRRLEILKDKEDVPLVDSKYVIPSTYTVKIHARSPEGKTISGVLVTHIGPSPSTTINGVTYGRYRIHYRFDGTISDPSLLGIKQKKFTLKRTIRDWLSHPDGP
ncbi:MAG TPA: hypothetical protein VIM61_04695 [Chthoniobacterales bacterium]